MTQPLPGYPPGYTETSSVGPLSDGCPVCGALVEHECKGAALDASAPPVSTPDPH